MGLTIREIRDNTTRARHLMQRSRQQHFAVGVADVDDGDAALVGLEFCACHGIPRRVHVPVAIIHADPTGRNGFCTVTACAAKPWRRCP